MQGVFLRSMPVVCYFFGIFGATKTVFIIHWEVVPVTYPPR